MTITNRIKNRLVHQGVKMKRFFHNLRFILFELHDPLGHYYSPVFSKEEILKRENRIFDLSMKSLEGIELNESQQFGLLKKFLNFYEEIPFEERPRLGSRYFYQNSFYKHFDAICLYSMIRLFQPKRIIEVGSGFTSSVILDTNDRFLEPKLHCTFIEPYPERLRELLNEDDTRKHELLAHPVQDVDPEVFLSLKKNDILFIDSSHVCKTGSDLNHIIFSVLPDLNPGVLIHFHDIFFPFEYPKDWILKGINWNENYMLRSFLMYNKAFKIVLFNSYLEHQHKEWLKEHMPLCLENMGQSLWLQKT